MRYLKTYEDWNNVFFNYGKFMITISNENDAYMKFLNSTPGFIASYNDDNDGPAHYQLLYKKEDVPSSVSKFLYELSSLDNHYPKYEYYTLLQYSDERFIGTYDECTIGIESKKFNL